MNGRMVSIEGGEGAGKSTLLAGLRQALAQRNIDAAYTREPGGTPIGEAIRALVLDPRHRGVAPETELLLMFAARAQLVRSVLRPALAAGRWVICDRFTDASYAYQGGGRGVAPARIAELERIATAGLKPDLTLLLDLPVASGRERASQRGGLDRIEAERDDFFERVRNVYRDRAHAEPGRFCVIDATQAPGAVLAAAVAAIDALRAGEGT